MQCFKFFISLVGLLALGACAKVSNNQTPLSNVVVKHGLGLALGVATQTSVQGNWKNDCTYDVASKGYYIAKISFQNSVMTTDTTSYDSATCTGAIAEEIRISNFALSTVGTASHLVDTIKVLEYRPLVAPVVTDFNQTKFCSTTSWSLGQKQTFTNPSDCGDLGNAIDYQIEIYGNSQEMYLNSCANGSTATGCSVAFAKDNS